MKKKIATSLLALSFTTLLAFTAQSAENLEGWRAAVSKMMESTPVTISTPSSAKLEVVKEVAAERKLTCSVEQKGDTFRATITGPAGKTDSAPVAKN